MRELSLTFVLSFSNLTISLMRHVIPRNIRMIVELSVIASLVIVADDDRLDRGVRRQQLAIQRLHPPLEIGNQFLQLGAAPVFLLNQIEAAHHRRGQRRPRSFEDLAGLKIMVIADSSYEESLELARIDVPELEWEPRSDVGMEELLLAVSDGAIDATLVDSNIFSLNGGFYPRVAIGFTLPDSIPHAWAFQKGPDRSLVQQAEVFIDRVKEDGTLAALQSAFYDVGDRLTRVDMRQFMSQVRDRLPPLVPMFREVADAYGMDWRLLAAIGYQESHWDPEASSYTGVRGLMMLTRRTANQLGVTDRLDPRQSIDGGARYFLDLHDRLPSGIEEPDRTWMALAAYNMGMGHLEDVRVITQKRGEDPDSWDDVRDNLELLTQESWYRDTRYGYALGDRIDREESMRLGRIGIAQDISTPPDRLDVVLAARGFGELLAKLADENVDDLQFGLVHATIEVVEEHLLGERGHRGAAPLAVTALEHPTLGLLDPTEELELAGVLVPQQVGGDKDQPFVGLVQNVKKLLHGLFPNYAAPLHLQGIA